MKFKEIRLAWQEGLLVKGLADGSSPADLQAELNDLFSKLARYDDRPAKEVIKMMATLKPRRQPAEHDSDSAHSRAEALAVVDLEAAFDDDSQFRLTLDRIRHDRLVTREGLNRVYCQLFGKTRTIGTKVTREKLIQDIGDLRLERVRSKRASEYFSGKVAS